MQTNVFFFRISHIDAPAAPKFTFLHPLIFMMPHLSHCALQLHSLCCIMNFQMMLCIERQLEMEDAKDDDDGDDDDWEDMEFEDDMENMAISIC